jgi:hypothetical protein
MRVSRSRWLWQTVAVFIVMLQAVIPQRVFAQWRAEMLPGLRFGPPLKAGVALGVAYGNKTGPSPFAGPFAVAEGALGGARVSAGYLLTGPFASGVEVLGSALRTWGNPSQIEKNRTLAGGELRVSFFLVNAGLGVFRPVDGMRTDRRTRYFLNLGLGI